MGWPDNSIGTLAFDSGSVEPLKGEKLTGPTSSTIGYVLTVNKVAGTWADGDVSGSIELRGCAGCFNDNENITGSVGGANILTVNHPDGAVGADRHVKNGAFAHDLNGPADWSGADATLTTEAEGQVTNCMMITDAGANPRAYQSFATEIGKIYTATIYFKKGTATSGLIKVGTAADDDTYYNSGAITDAEWTAYTITFEAVTVLTFITNILGVSSVGQTHYFDEITLYEQGEPSIKLGPEDSETTLPELSWRVGGGPGHAVARRKLIKEATMSDGSKRFAFFAMKREFAPLEWGYLTKVELDILIGLHALNQVLHYQNNWEAATWHDVVMVSFNYDPVVETYIVRPVRYRCSMVLREA